MQYYHLIPQHHHEKYPSPHFVQARRAYLQKSEALICVCDPVTLRCIGAQAPGTQRAQAQRLQLQKEQITPENITPVTTLFLLRLRDETVRATYRRYWESLENVKPRKVEWEVPEGDGNTVDRQENLLRYIDQHMALIEQYGKAIRSSEFATRRLASANRSGGDRHRYWCQLNDAIAEELARRKSEIDPPAQADLEKSAQAPVLQYPAQSAAEVTRME